MLHKMNLRREQAASPVLSILAFKKWPVPSYYDPTEFGLQNDRLNMHTCELAPEREDFGRCFMRSSLFFLIKDGRPPF